MAVSDRILKSDTSRLPERGCRVIQVGCQNEDIRMIAEGNGWDGTVLKCTIEQVLGGRIEIGVLALNLQS